MSFQKNVSKVLFLKSWIFRAFVLDDVKYKLLHLQGGKAFSKLVTLASLSSHREIQYNSAGTLGQLALVSKYSF